jgi:hypothetical protein
VSRLVSITLRDLNHAGASRVSPTLHLLSQYLFRSLFVHTSARVPFLLSPSFLRPPRSLGDQAHAQLAGGGTTSEALTLAALQQQRTSAALNAYTTTTHEAAARAALESDQRRAAGMCAGRPTGEIFVVVVSSLSESIARASLLICPNSASFRFTC